MSTHTPGPGEVRDVTERATIELSEYDIAVIARSGLGPDAFVRRAVQHLINEQVRREEELRRDSDRAELARRFPMNATELQLLAVGNKLAAVRSVRERYDLGLREALRAVEGGP